MKKIVVVLIAVLALMFAGCGNKKYGSESHEEVIKRYMQDLEKKDTDDGRKCFPEGLKIALGAMWAPDNDDAYVVSWYHWNLDTLTISDPTLIGEEAYEVKYGRNFEDVRSYEVTCGYQYMGTESVLSFTFDTCRYMGRYYVLNVTENGEAVCDPDDIGSLGSFTLDSIESYDHVYLAYIEPATRENPLVKIWITNQETGEADYIEPFRRADFWGMCWENDNYRLWLQSGDIGLVCYTLRDGDWVLDEEAVLPDYIVSKYE